MRKSQTLVSLSSEERERDGECSRKYYERNRETAYYEFNFMPLIQSWNNLLESIGEAAGQSYKRSRYYAQINAPVIEIVCALWSKYPRQIPLLPYTRAFANSVCAQVGSPLPQLPPPEFIGGQCDFQYSCVVTSENFFNGESQGITDSPTFIVFGPIAEIGIRQNPNLSTNFIETYVIGLDVLGNVAVRTSPIGGIGFSADLISTTITPLGGQADTCGDPPSTYPPDPPIDPSDFVEVVDVDIYDENVNIIDTISVPIQINPSVELNFPITINIGGKDHSLGDDGLSTEDKPNPDGNLTRRTLPPPNADDYNEEVGEEESGEEKQFEEVLVWVKLEITQKPENAKRQFGDGAPDVFYCGWFEFQLDGASFHRTPIHFEQAIFLAPEYANGYAFTVYQGFLAKATAYTEKREVEEEEE